MRLHKIRVEKISLFRLMKCAVKLLLTITCNVKVQPVRLMCTEVYHICILYKS